ncbi:MAG: tripartite tricarboxylate transporter substrate binding protein BugE [Sheuella sp.]|nr:tripartite tricarboxylate transporter substrate binding protein BugE [Sheuella sp.]
MKRRLVLACVTGLMACAGMTCAMAQTQSKTIRLVVPFPAGGSTDIAARVLAEPLSRILGQTVVVENRGGAGGSIGMMEVAKAAPDGTTFGVATVSTHGVNPAVYKNLPYDPIKNFAPVTELVEAPGVLLVNATLPVQNFAQFMDYLKANPDKLSYASTGNGTVSHMWAELFKTTTKTSMTHVPYKGAGPALNDLVGGQVMVYFDQVASAMPHIKSGKLRPLAVSWPTRLEPLPDVPTYAELNLASNNDPSWFGLVAPIGTPEKDIQRVRDAAAKALSEPAVRERLAGMGLFPTGSTPAEFGEIIRKEILKMQGLAKTTGIAID